MSVVIKLRRGLLANLPSEASEGEALVTTDTGQLFLGMGPGQALKPITGGESGQIGTVIDDEDLSIYVNGQRVLFTVNHGRYVPGSLKVYVNGMRLRKSTQADSHHFDETNPALGTFELKEVFSYGTVLIVDYRTT